MALITTDLERQGNLTLTETGEELANRLIPATLAWAQRRLGFSIARGSVTDYADLGGSLFFLPNPVNVASVTAATHNSAGGPIEGRWGNDQWVS